VALKTELHVGDIGSTLRILVLDGIVPFDISSATKKDFVLKPPIGAKKTIATIVFTQPPDGAGDGSDGLLDWLTMVVGDLDEAGSWEVQVDLDVPAAVPPWIGMTEVVRFKVAKNL